MIFLLKLLATVLLTVIFLLFLVFITRTIFTVRLAMNPDKKKILTRVMFFNGIIGVMVGFESSVLEIFLIIANSKIHILRKIPSKKEKPTAALKSEKQEVKPKEKTKKKPPLFTVREWISLGKEVVRRFFKIPKNIKITADLEVGLENPATTGYLMSAYYSLYELFPFMQKIRIEPSFVEKKFLGTIDLSGSIRLIHVVRIVIFISGKMIVQMFKMRRKRHVGRNR
ncbi:MAG: hypothetical protein PHW79_02985 [Candidatus Marinimicrobia bacterium]|nr:hypothetical protein [Candidatus Neomarinimicrobiota bacterium]